MIQLRDYQQDLVDGVQAALGDEQARIMMQLPTGGGKTVIAGALLNAWLKGGRKAVWLTHRRELVRQTWELPDDANVETCYKWDTSARGYVEFVDCTSAQIAGTTSIPIGASATKAKTWPTLRAPAGQISKTLALSTDGTIAAVNQALSCKCRDLPQNDQKRRFGHQLKKSDRAGSP